MEPTKPSLAFLDSGNCEPLKATCHGVALVLADELPDVIGAGNFRLFWPVVAAAGVNRR